MTLSSAIMASELNSNLSIVDNEAEAISNLSAAFEGYLYNASVLGITATVGSLSGAIAAMQGAMTGLSTAGSTAIQAGLTAAWGVIASAASTIWATTPPPTGATPPPSLGTIAATLESIFASNTAGGLNQSDSCQAIAAVLHPLMLGGICILPPAPTGPGPQPIL
jgi:hypothetical protein